MAHTMPDPEAVLSVLRGEVERCDAEVAALVRCPRGALDLDAVAEAREAQARARETLRAIETGTIPFEDYSALCDALSPVLASRELS